MALAFLPSFPLSPFVVGAVVPPRSQGMLEGSLSSNITWLQAVLDMQREVPLSRICFFTLSPSLPRTSPSLCRRALLNLRREGALALLRCATPVQVEVVTCGWEGIDASGSALERFCLSSPCLPSLHLSHPPTHPPTLSFSHFAWREEGERMGERSGGEGGRE